MIFSGSSCVTHFLFPADCALKWPEFGTIMQPADQFSVSYIRSTLCEIDLSPIFDSKNSVQFAFTGSRTAELCFRDKSKNVKNYGIFRGSFVSLSSQRLQFGGVHQQQGFLCILNNRLVEICLRDYCGSIRIRAHTKHRQLG